MKHPVFVNVELEQVRLIRVTQAGTLVAELPGTSSLQDVIQACQLQRLSGDVELAAVDRNGSIMVDRQRVQVPRVPHAADMQQGPNLLELADKAGRAQQERAEQVQASSVLERAHAAEIDTIRRNAKAEIEATRAELERALSPLRAQIAEFEARQLREKTIHAEEIERMRRRALDDLAEAQARHDRRAEALERARRDEVEELQKRHDRQIDRLEAEAERLRDRIGDLQDRIARVNTETIDEVRAAHLERVKAETAAEAARGARRSKLAETLGVMAELEQSGASKESRELALKLIQDANSEPESPTAMLLKEIWKVAKENGPQLAQFLTEKNAATSKPNGQRKEIA